MCQKEEIYKIIENWNEFYAKVYGIIELHGEKDDLYYDIKEINHDPEKDHLTVQVEYYKWQDNNEKIIYIDTKLLTNEEEFNEFKSKVEQVVISRKQEEEKKLEEKKKKEIQDALELLKKNGVIKED